MRRGKREVVDVPEPRRQDQSLARLIQVRKQRLGRLERERNEARQQWREGRAALRVCKEQRRQSLNAAHAFWNSARERFLQMSTTSGDLRKAKATYERMKDDAARCYLAWQEQLARCEAAGRAFFGALSAVLAANRQQEKLHIVNDEMRQLAARNED
jgi:chromosome segregation ATPase